MSTFRENHGSEEIMTIGTTAAMPSQHGRRAIVTGATGGLGYETAAALADAGAEVILAGRNPQKGQAALARIRAQQPEAQVDFELLDLASLASVAAFCARISQRCRTLDLLINNAGVMALPERQVTEDGFEMQLGVNYLGHFALTAKLLPLLRTSGQARVVQLSSIAHRRGEIDLDDLQSERHYHPWRAYRQSKLAMLMFALELQRQSQRAGWGIVSNAAHPGVARTDLFTNGPAANGRRASIWLLAALAVPFFSQSAADGALPTLYAATALTAQGGGYYGPAGWQELQGPPVAARIMPQALDVRVAAELWQRSVALTGAEWGDGISQRVLESTDINALGA